MTPTNDTSSAGRCEVRGTSFQALLRALQELHGQHAARTALRVLPPHLSELAAGRIVRGGWYPLADYAQLHEAAARVVGAGPELAEAIGRHAATTSLFGVARFVMPEPVALVRELERLLSGQLRGPSWATRTIGEGAAEITVTGLVGGDERVRHELAGTLAALLERSGGTDVVVQARAGAAPSSTVLTARWR